MLRKLALAFMLLPSTAFAQGAVQQNGVITPFDMSRFANDHVVESAGGLTGKNGRGVNPFAIVDTDGLAICTYDTAPISTALNSLCLGHNASGGPVYSVNGTTYNFAPGNGTIVGPNTSVAGHSVLFNNTGGTLARDAGVNITYATADLTGAASNTATLNTQSAAAVAAGGQAIMLPSGQIRLDTQANTPATTLWLTSPGTYFSGASGAIVGNIDLTLTNTAGRTLYGMIGQLDFGGATPNQVELLVTAYIPATNSSGGYQKSTTFFESYSVDPSTYGNAAVAGVWAPILVRESVALEARSWSAVTNGRTFAGHFLVTSQAGNPSVLTGVNIETNNLSASPDGYANQKDSVYALSIDNVGNTLSTAAIWIAPGSALFQDGIVFDYTSVNSNYLAVYSGPGTGQTTRFAIQKLGTSGMEFTWTGGGGASDVWIAHTDAADTALYFNSPSNHIFKIGGSEAANVSANGLLVDTGLVVGIPAGGFKGASSVNTINYYSNNLLGLTISAVASGTCTLTISGGIITGKVGC